MLRPDAVVATVLQLLVMTILVLLVRPEAGVATKLQPLKAPKRGKMNRPETAAETNLQPRVVHNVGPMTKKCAGRRQPSRSHPHPLVRPAHRHRDLLKPIRHRGKRDPRCCRKWWTGYCRGLKGYLAKPPRSRREDCQGHTAYQKRWDQGSSLKNNSGNAWKT